VKPEIPVNLGRDLRFHLNKVLLEKRAELVRRDAATRKLLDVRFGERLKDTGAAHNALQVIEKREALLMQ
jgi:hypothetical protein